MAYDDEGARRAVARALDEDEPFEALTALQTAWLATRSAVLRELLLALDARLASIVPPTAGKTDKAFVQAWVDRVRSIGPIVAAEPDPTARITLFALTRELVPRIANSTPASLLPCLDAIAELAGEPCLSLLAEALLRLQRGNGLTSAAMKMHRRGLELACASGDVPGARALISHYRGTIPQPLNSMGTAMMSGADKRLLQLDQVRLVAAAEPEWKSLAAVIERVEPRELPTVAPRASRSGSTEAELLARVAENPSDDETLSVLADLWQEAGNPRGEFLALQLLSARGEATPAQLAREAALLEKYRKAWLGPLAGVLVLGSLRFERGFLTACSLAPKKQSQFEVLKSDPRWRTVRRLSSVRVEWLTPELRALETLRVGHFNFFSAGRLRLVPPTLRQVEVLEWYAQYFEDRLHGLLAAAPQLETFSCLVNTKELEGKAPLAIVTALGRRVRRQTTAPPDTAELHQYSLGGVRMSTMLTLHLQPQPSE